MGHSFTFERWQQQQCELKTLKKEISANITTIGSTDAQNSCFTAMHQIVYNGNHNLVENEDLPKLQ